MTHCISRNSFPGVLFRSGSLPKAISKGRDVEENGDKVAADVAILGGGPAGAATALALAELHPDLTVVLLEASRYEEVRVGESLHPGVESLLRELGVWDAFLSEEHLPAHGTRAYWGSPEPIENEFLFHRNGRGWHLDRRRFDHFLARMAEERGAILMTQARALRGAHCERGIWHLRASREHRPIELAVRFVVDATGRAATFARQHGASRLQIDRLASVCALTTLPPQVAIDTCTLVEACAAGWWYSARLPDDQMIVALMTDADLAPPSSLRSFGDFAARAGEEAPHTARRLLGARPRSWLLRRAASSHRLDRFGGPGWLAVGDAALGFDPLSSGGITFALRSALFAARALGDALAGDSAGLAGYERFLEAELEGYLAARDDYYGKEGRFAEAPFWQRRQRPVTLDPRTLLTCPPGGTAKPRALRTLPHQALDLLLSLCPAPKPAHQIAAAFRQRTGGRFSDRRIVLALQDLLQAGELAAVAAIAGAGETSAEPAA